MSRLGRSVALTLALCLQLAEGGSAMSDGRLALLESFLQQHLEQNPVPGFSAVVVVGDEIVFENGYGVTVLGESGRVTAHSPIGIGSLAKSMTAVGVLRLVEDGKLELDAPVTDYLPWFRTADRRSSEITVRMLLHNISGLPSTNRWLTSSNRSEGAAEASVRALSSIPLVREPGKSFEYANENWMALGVLITEVTELPYSTYLQRHVLEPMGMRESTTALDLFDEKQVLYGHYTGVARARPARPRFLADGLAAGSELRASARDIGRYLITLLNEGNYRGTQVLASESVKLLFAPGVKTTLYMPEMGLAAEEAGYAMGWVVTQAEGRVVHHHGGDAIVMGSWTMLDRDAKVGASVLYNGPSLDPYRFQSKIWLVHNLVRIVQGLPVSDFGLPTDEDPTRNEYHLPVELLPRYVGSYLSSGGSRADISVNEEGSGLVLTAGSLDLDFVYEIDFASESATVLRNISGATQMRFLMTPAGKVTGLEGGLFGGRYRKLDERNLEGQQEVRSLDGSIKLRLPRSWSWNSDGDRILAKSNSDPQSHLNLQFSDLPWGDRRAIIWTEARGSSPEPREGTETMGHWVWQEVIWYRGSGPEARQSVLLSTDLSNQRFEITLTTARGQLTNQIREVLLPLLTHLVIRSR